MSLVTVDVPEIEEISEIVITCSLLMVGTTKILGDCIVGHTVSADLSDIHVDASNVIPMDFGLRYEWYRNGDLIEEAVSKDYILTEDDADAKLKVKVIATQPGFEGEVESNEVVVQSIDDYGEDEEPNKGE